MSEDELMTIPLVDGWNRMRLGQRPYPVGQKDRELMDKTLNELHCKGRMTWVTKPTPFATPVFVAWRRVNGIKKGRVVADLRALNKAAIPDAYPLPLPETIMASLIGKRYITVIDIKSSFHQYGVHPDHQDRFTITSHRGLERSTVALMGFRNSPAHVQRFMDQLLRNYPFARCYIDDIVIFSDTGREHVQHLKEIFRVLQRVNLAVNPAKSWVGYDSVELLGFRVDAFGLSNTEERVKAIRNIRMPNTLKNLEYYIGLTGFVRHLVPEYGIFVEPLQKRKTALLADGREKGKTETRSKRRSYVTRASFRPTPEETAAFQAIQDRLCARTTLRHFDRRETLYLQLDASAQRGFAAVVFHTKPGFDWQPSTIIPATTIPDTAIPATAIPATAIQPVMYLSKALTNAERSYGPLELEVGCLAWAARKTRTMLKSAERPVVVLTDHHATKGIVEKTTLDTTSVD